jgi:beta-lactamase superfamily II metal-dependent hydrolase
MYFLGIACATLLGSIYFYEHVHTTNTLQISFIDVGQGDGMLIRTPSNKYIVVDGGISTQTLSYVQEALPYFSKTLDIVIATHPDADHITGLIPLLSYYNVHHIVISPAQSETATFTNLMDAVYKEESGGAEVHTGNRGDSIDLSDGVTITIVHPKSEVWHGEETNDESVTTLLTYGERTFLLTGDLPSTYEGDIVRSGTVPRNITVLKAGHHGSKYSSSDIFLQYLHPEYTIISAGKNNRYGHPNPEALGRIQKVTDQILSTIDYGTITFSTDGRNLSIETEK